jgi:general secretion pathway protein A
MYCDFYGFREPPFSLTPDPRFLFLSAQHREALDHLAFGIRERKGFIQLTGEVGSGKTTLCRAFLETLDSGTATALILNPRMSEAQLLRAIMKEFAIADIARDSLTNYDRLNAWLLARLHAGQDAVLIIDEAQDLTIAALEQVRLLSNLETDSQKLIQIVLMGQPELRAMIDTPALRQLRQRITVRYHLGCLDRTETDSYLRYRMLVAGHGTLPTFEPAAVHRIWRYSGGTPRLINALADRALLAGFVHRTEHISLGLTKLAERELEGHCA